MRQIFSLGLVIISAAVLAGCSSISSSGVSTSSMYFTIAIDHVSGESTAAATAAIRAGGVTGSYLSLESGDTLTCNSVALNKSTDSLGAITYSNAITYETSGTYRFDFYRADEGTYTSVATLPAAVTISSPADGVNIAKGNAIAVQWSSGTGDSYQIRLNRSGFTYNATESDDDATSYTIPASKTTTEASGTVAATVRVKRVTSGVLNSSLSGTIVASEAHEIDINLID